MSMMRKVLTHPLVRKVVVDNVTNIVKDLPAIAYYKARSAIGVRLTITNFDPTFVWLSAYLAQQSLGRKSHNFTLLSTDKLRNFSEYEEAPAPNAKDWMLVPSTGVWRFMRNKSLFTVSRVNAGGNKQGAALEYIIIEVFNGTREDIDAWLVEARGTLKIETSTSINLYNGYWQRVGTKAPRQMATIVMPEGKKERIFEDIERFMASRDWYRSRGIPYHRGYLFTGPPGSGKTSMIDAIASRFGKSIATVNLGSVKDDDELYDAFLTMPRNAIIALEDIDCLTASHERTDDNEKYNKHGKEQGITLAGLLNCLDGIVTPDGAIIIMSSNHPEKLDPALVRPGRADVIELFDHLERTEQQTFSKLFYSEAIEGVDVKISAAKLQSIFMDHLNDVEAAQADLESLALQMTKPKMSTRKKNVKSTG